MRLLWAAALLAASLISADAEGRAATTRPAKHTFYLSPTGSDSNDGSSPQAAWATLPHAVSALRLLRPRQPAVEDRAALLLLPGTYTLQETLLLDARDSFLHIAAYPVEGEVIISGGRELDLPWQEEGGIRTASFNGTCAEVFLDSWRLLPARSPNTAWGPNLSQGKGPWNYVAGLLEETDTCVRENPRGFQQKDCPESNKLGFVLNDELGADWEDLQHTEVLVFHSWIAEYAKVANISTVDGRQEVRFQKPLRHDPVGAWPVSGNWRYLVLNNMAVLDQEGEMVCIQESDKSARLSYIPPVGLKNKHPVLAVLATLLQASRTASLSLAGLSFQHSSSNKKDKWGSKNEKEAAVRLIEVEDATVMDCQFAHIGYIGLFIQSSHRVQVLGTEFWDVGFHGILVFDKPTGSHQHPNTTSDILIDDNNFRGCGASKYWAPAGIWAGAGERNITISHNEFTNIIFTPIKVAKMSAKTANNEEVIFNVEYNYIHDYGGKIISDFGAIKVNGGAVCQTNSTEVMEANCYTHTRVYNNWIEDGSSYYHGPSGLYSDNAGCGTIFENNIIRGTAGKALYHHCGIDNESKNNIIHRSGNHSTSFGHIWAGCESNTDTLQRFSNYHNIYLFDSVQELHMSKSISRFYNEAPDFHHNLYWSPAEGAEAHLMFRTGPARPKVYTDFAGWQESGNDTNSLWTDPLFGDSAAGDFTLGAMSPARELGIQQVDTASIGRRPPALGPLGKL